MALIPKFSIRQLLWFMIAAAFVCACLAGAARGGLVAYGLCVALFGLLLPAIVLVVVYWAAYLVGLLTSLVVPIKGQPKSPGELS